MKPQREHGRVLLVDDEPGILTCYERMLGRHGWKIESARNGHEANACLASGSFDVIVSDISMPGQDGLAFVRGIRDYDPDVPVILATGAPTMDSSIRAVEYGVFRYLLKPVANDVLVDVVSRASRMHRLAKLKRYALEAAAADGTWLGDRAELANRFASAIDVMWMAFQPIVQLSQRRVFGYEALLRTDESTLANPLEFVGAAERLRKVHELGRAVRAKVAEASRQLPRDAQLFVNLHAHDLGDEALHAAESAFSSIAGSVVLEITERASLDSVADLPLQIRALKEMGFRIAIDDLGAGYAGLTSVTQLEPELVKLDMSLVRGIDANPTKQSIVGSMKNLFDELGMAVVAEGVETPAERDMLRELGCDLLQGYLFGRPARGFMPPQW